MDIRRLTVTQKELLESAAKQVKLGGYLVYSTCTIEPEENFDIINDFVMSQPDFELVDAREQFGEELCNPYGCIQTYTNVHQIDGSFAAKLKKTR